MDSKSCLACSYNGPELQRFPRDKKRMIQWLEAVNRKDLLEKKDFYMAVYTKGRLCNSHFNEWCFDAENKKKLMKYAIPVQNQPNTAEPNNVSLPLKAMDQQKFKEEKKDVIPKSSDEDSKDLDNCNRPEAHESGNNEIIENLEEKEPKEDEFTGGGKNVKENKEECESGGLEHNFEIERIIGATDVPGELMFLIKWKDCTVTELLPARMINEKYPRDVIKFYEGRLIWREAQCENS